MISQQALEQLINLTVTRIKRTANNTLIDAFPGQGLRFNIKLEHLLPTEMKSQYYDAVLTILIKEI